MKRKALATLVPLIICSSGVGAQSLSVEKIKDSGINFVPAAGAATTKKAKRQLPRALPEHLRTSSKST